MPWLDESLFGQGLFFEESGMKPVEHPEVRHMSAVERSEAQMRVAEQSPEHMKRWLADSGRTWIVFNGPMLVDSMDSLIWGEKVRELQLLIANYRDHRAGLPDPLPETLTVDELDRAIRYLVGQITDLEPTWTLESAPR